MKKIREDLRTLEWTDALELFAAAGTVCAFAAWALILSGELPL